ncbi:unnamed protein product, partial [Brenthis ino]
MDFINQRVQNKATFIDHNSSATRKADILEIKNEKPLALFYRTERKSLRQNSVEQKHSNSTLPLPFFATSTDYTSTIYDLFYDENSSTIDHTLTTETYFTSTEWDNVTEITFFDKKSTSSAKPSQMPKKINKTNKTCHCDLLYKHCDIHCCCDNDCSEKDHNVFRGCKETSVGCFGTEKNVQHLCSLPACNGGSTTDLFHNLFCIDKVNLPDKRKINKNKFHTIDINKFLKWHTNDKDQPLHEFTRTEYELGHPVWLLRNETLNIIKLPTTVTNQYCNGQRHMKFLQNEHIKCYVKIKDLHMLHILELASKTNVISPMQETSNNTALNCTTLHCTRWTILVCDARTCVYYNEVLHEPSCSNSYCNNVGTKVEYILYCNGSIITKAVLKFHVRQVPVAHQFVTQDIVVNYYMGNDSVDDIVKYSGNPGYMRGYEVIASFAENNHTKFFYNRTHGKRSHLSLPYNENGQCLSTNFTYNKLIFGQNKRIICRLNLDKNFLKHNRTDQCLKIQETIIELLQLNKSIFISPRGNPSDISDIEWITLRKFNKSDIYGQYRSNDSKFLCYNLITRFAFIFIFADDSVDVTEQYKILSAKVESTARNVTFNTDSLSVILTVDTSFIDASAPAALEYGGAPHLDIHLPKNFFFPSQSTACKVTLAKFLYLSAIVFLNK